MLQFFASVGTLTRLSVDLPDQTWPGDGRIPEAMEN